MTSVKLPANTFMTTTSYPSGLTEISFFLEKDTGKQLAGLITRQSSNCKWCGHLADGGSIPAYRTRSRREAISRMIDAIAAAAPPKEEGPMWKDMVNAFLQEKYDLPMDWLAFKIVALEPYDQSPGNMVTGARTPLKQKGKFAGTPHWAKRDRSTEKTFLVPTDQFSSFCARQAKEQTTQAAPS